MKIKNKPKVKLILALLLFISIILLSGCSLIKKEDEVTSLYITSDKIECISDGHSTITFTATGTYQDGTIKEISADSYFMINQESKQMVTFPQRTLKPYQNKSGTYGVFAKVGTVTSNTITVIYKEELIDIELTSPPTKTKYFTGEKIDLTGLIITGIYSDKTKKIETVTESAISEIDTLCLSIGTKTVTITVGGKTKTYQITVTDNIKPIITLSGNNNITIDAGTNYIDEGATASDNIDKDLTSKIAITNPVNTLLPATYEVKYNVSDNSNNKADEVIRTVTVKDITKPIITSFKINNGAEYTTTSSVTLATLTNINTKLYYSLDSKTWTDGTANQILTLNEGINIVYAKCVDLLGNQNITTASIKVDTIKPIITLNGLSNIDLELGKPYLEEGATVTDTFSSNLTVKISGTVNNLVGADYEIKYTASDNAGNEADALTRMVTVKDSTKPVISSFRINM